MKAVNLIPKESRRSRGPVAGLGFSPSYGVLAVLGVALVFALVYVLTANTISDRKAKLASVQAQLAAQQAVHARLAKYVTFEQLARTRVQTVREIAAARFNWYQAMTDLSKVVPATTSLQALTATVAPGASAGGSSATSSSSVRGAESVPAFELNGCSTSQVNVARLMSRLRLINGVTRVTLGSSQEASSTGGASSGSCSTDQPAFDIVVFFQALPAAGPDGVASVPTSTGTSGSGSSSTSTSTTKTTSGTSQ